MVLLLLVLACTDGPGSAEGAPRAPAAAPVPRLTTPDGSYLLTPEGQGYSATIPFSYRNDGADTIYVTHCNRQLTLQLFRRDEDGWREYWNGETDGCLSAPLVIAPGATFTDTLHVWGAKPPTLSVNTFAGRELTGTYRMRWNQLLLRYTGRPPFLGDTLPILVRESSEFTLEEVTDRSP